MISELKEFWGLEWRLIVIILLSTGFILAARLIGKALCKNFKDSIESNNKTRQEVADHKELIEHKIDTKMDRFEQTVHEFEMNLRSHEHRTSVKFEKFMERLSEKELNLYKANQDIESLKGLKEEFKEMRDSYGRVIDIDRKLDEKGKGLEIKIDKLIQAYKGGAK